MSARRNPPSSPHCWKLVTASWNLVSDTFELIRRGLEVKIVIRVFEPKDSFSSEHLLRCLLDLDQRLSEASNKTTSSCGTV